MCDVPTNVDTFHADVKPGDLLTHGRPVIAFLLNAILAQASPYSDRSDASHLGQIFAESTLDTLAQEVDRRGSIFIIQGLLI